MLDELKSIETQLKKVLYGCVEHVQATKAALYLSASRDLTDKRFEIVTHYGYNPADRQVVTANDDLVDRLAVKRSPFFVNGLAADQRFAEMLFRQGNDRMLAAPIFARGRMIGFIDMRDKAGRKPFDAPDVQAAQQIAEDMVRVLSANNIFGLAPITLVEETALKSTTLFTPMSTPALTLPQPPLPPQPAAGTLSAAATQAIDAARQFIARRQLNRESSARMLTEPDLETVRVMLPAVLGVPGAQLVAFSAMGHLSNPQIVMAGNTVTEKVLERLQVHLTAWLTRQNQAAPRTQPQISYPFGTRDHPLTALGPTFSAPVNVYSVEGLVLTTSFDAQPTAQAQRALRTLLRQIEQGLETATTAVSGRSERVLIAERLLEPDFQKYPELADHSREVAVIAQRFARVLEMASSQVETVRIAALVHDVGLRLLDYDRFYRAATLPPEELRLLHEHPVVGAALVEPVLGADVAQAVLRHHERVDGQGYPSRLTGQQIPIASRIIQIADAWVAMTSAGSYQPPVEREVAATRMRESAGSHFDAALLEKFLGNLTDIVP